MIDEAYHKSLENYCVGLESDVEILRGLVSNLVDEVANLTESRKVGFQQGESVAPLDNEVVVLVCGKARSGKSFVAKSLSDSLTDKGINCEVLYSGERDIHRMVERCEALKARSLKVTIVEKHCSR